MITVNAGDNTAIDISAGSGIVVDASDPDRATQRRIVWPDITAVSITDIANHPTTFIGISADLSITQSDTFPENGQLRTDIELGAALHENLTSITSVSQLTSARPFQQAVTMTEFGDAIGVVKLRDPDGINNLIIEGDPAGNLSIKRGAGKVFSQGSIATPCTPTRLKRRTKPHQP